MSYETIAVKVCIRAPAASTVVAHLIMFVDEQNMCFHHCVMNEINTPMTVPISGIKKIIIW